MRFRAPCLDRKKSAGCTSGGDPSTGFLGRESKRTSQPIVTCASNSGEKGI